MHKRAVISFVFILAFLGGLMLRIYDISGQQLHRAAEQQAGLTVTVANARGTIYDCMMRPLVNSDTEYRVIATANPEAIAAVSGCVDKKTLESFTARLQEGKPAVAVIDTLPPPADGLALFETPVRHRGTLLAPHIVGYLDGDGIKGATGAELVFNELLSEYAGKLTVTYTVDAVGKPLEGIEPIITNTLDKAKAGVMLTIDKDIQMIAENAARDHLTKGAVVVMEPGTGRISALVSLPDFQPSTLSEALDDQNSPLINRAFSNYNCGSVFKIVTTAAALENGISTSSKHGCQGSFHVGDVKFHCHNRLGHGMLSMLEGFAQSCNPYFIQLALQAGGASLYNMSADLGFDRPVFLAEGWKTARAVLPSQDQLVSPAAVGNLAFGQGVLMATPVHIAQLISTAVNRGNLIRPTLIKGTVDFDGILTEQPPTPSQSVFSENTAGKLKDMMIYAVESGTGASARPTEGGAGGKTGTAETGWVVNGKSVIQGWFAGFYPSEDPTHVIVVLAEDIEGTGGKAAPVFKQICEELSMLEITRQSNDHY